VPVETPGIEPGSDSSGGRLAPGLGTHRRPAVKHQDRGAVAIPPSAYASLRQSAILTVVPFSVIPTRLSVALGDPNPRVAAARDRRPVRDNQPVVRTDARAAWRGAIAGAIAALAVTVPALAREAPVDTIVAALRHGSVYASPAARPTLVAAQARRVAREVAKRDPSRIKVVVVSEAEASRAGGVTALANELDKRLGAPGTVFVTAGSRSWLVTSFADTDAATAAVQQAFEAHDALVDQLREAVAGIAAVDPGPDTSTGPSSQAPEPAGTHVSAAVWIVVAAVIGLPLAAWALLTGRRRWRAGRDARETFDDDLADARQQLVSLGDDIRDLDIDESMPGADPAGKRDYDEALDQYQRAERLLGEDANPRRLARANAALAEGRRLMDAARAQFADR
jgi:hypothetical protein